MEWKNDGVMNDKSGKKMKWEILRIEIVLNMKMTKFEKWLK